MRFRTIGLCLMVAFAISAVASATASAEAPEFGRCIKKAKVEGSGYSDGGCTAAVGSGAKYEWSSGPGAKAHFTSAARFVRTAPERHCIAWQKAKEAGNEKEAKEILEKYGLTEAECEEILKKAEGKEPAILETTTGNVVECGEVNSVGEYSGAKTVSNVTTTFSECELGEITCQSTGAKAGEIVGAALNGVLGVIKKEGLATNNKVGVALSPASGEVVAEFECGAFIKVVVTGSVIHQVLGNRMLLAENEKFLQSKGQQKPEKFEGEPTDVLESKINEASPVQSGLGLLTRLTNEEKIEVNTVV